MKTTFQWLSELERNFLLSLSPRAETTINRRFSRSDITEEKLYPFTPVGNHPYQQGTNRPTWMPKDCEVINENSNGTITITCPHDHSFYKYENRKGIIARVRRDYFPAWQKMVKAVMKPALRRLSWSIYKMESYGKNPHIYLNCAIPGPNKAKTVSLYVPISYFVTKNWNEVVELHTGLAVNYYRGGGFNVPPGLLAKWQDMTAAALDCAEAKELRKAVEKIK